MVNKTPTRKASGTRSRFLHDSASHGSVTVRRVFPVDPGTRNRTSPHALRRRRLSPEAVVLALRVLFVTAPLSLVQFASIIAPSCIAVNGIVKFQRILDQEPGNAAVPVQFAPERRRSDVKVSRSGQLCGRLPADMNHAHHHAGECEEGNGVGDNHEVVEHVGELPHQIVAH